MTHIKSGEHESNRRIRDIILRTPSSHDSDNTIFPNFADIPKEPIWILANGNHGSNPGEEVGNDGWFSKDVLLP